MMGKNGITFLIGYATVIKDTVCGYEEVLNRGSRCCQIYGQYVSNNVHVVVRVS